MQDTKYILLILPLQLFNFKQIYKDYPDIIKVYIIEEHWYFTRYPFHKQKLAYQRSCMKHYQQYIKEDFKIQTKYIDCQDVSDDFYKQLNQKYHSKLLYIDPIDKSVQTMLKRLLNVAQMIQTYNYWITISDMSNFKRKIRYNFNSFYSFQKIKFSQLLEKKSDFGLLKSKSQDVYNRNRIEKQEVPRYSILNLQQDTINKESIKYVNKHFSNNYGVLTDTILYPVTLEDSLKWLRQFFRQKLINFGKYQDSIDLQNPFLYHSIISPMLNVGILTDSIVIDELIKYLYKTQEKIPIQSLEAFIRQVLGWRNYIYMVYTLEDKNLHKQNQLNHYNKINKNFWQANTGIEIVDQHLKILENTSYLSHGGRLMVMDRSGPSTLLVHDYVH